MLSCELENFSQIFQLFSHQHSPREHFDFRSRFLCFQTANQKIRINSKILCPQSPSILVPRPRRLRDEKRAMGTRMTSKVTFSFPCNLQLHFRSFSKRILGVGELTYKRWRTDVRRWRIDFIRWRTGRWRTDTLAKRPVTVDEAEGRISYYLIKTVFYER